ncbi:MAG: hypothetical protein A2X32_01945 [Elusimicrobia bacterium GWC2_64_44]|nr:MAG: hypothetical protein A2X32_01945 [Elusimicrobia bacterium GWC2_64_44]
MKLAVVIAIMLGLMVPLNMIDSTLKERLGRRNEAVADITSSWGKEQALIGPVLIVPYRYSYKTLKDTVIKGVVSKVEVVETATADAWFLPERLNVDGKLLPEKLHRGIYEAVVYKGDITFSGKFAAPDPASLKLDGGQLQWADARVAFGVTDLRGTTDALELRFGGDAYRMTPGTSVGEMPDGVHARVGAKAKAGNLSFSLKVGLKGSGGVSFAPLGVENEVRLSSPWPDPSFKGQFLPTERTIKPEGFDALWKVSYYGRPYPQYGAQALPVGQLQGSMFGVSFYTAVDSYRMTERAIKYGVLFFTLVFAVFFLFETLASLRIHPVQYTLTGAALCLFYLGLLSLAEFIGFGWAYLGAALASAVLVTLYTSSVLGGGKRSLLVGAELAAIYGFLYVTLNLQDYSLLIGTVGLFAVLSLIMYLTRNVDWQQY